MNYKKSIYFIITIFIMFSISISPILGNDTDFGNIKNSKNTVSTEKNVVKVSTNLANKSTTNNKNIYKSKSKKSSKNYKKYRYYIKNKKKFSALDYQSKIKLFNLGNVKAKTIIKSKYKCGPKLVKFSNGHVVSTAKCSCGKAGSYKYYTKKFNNYCPFCKKPGYLKYEQGPTCPEGMWVCKKCDVDFCLVCGKEHISGTNKYLKK